MSNHPTSTDIPHGHYCVAHDGSKTHTFRVFKEIFLVNASAEFMRDDEYSIGDTIAWMLIKEDKPPELLPCLQQLKLGM